MNSHPIDTKPYNSLLRKRSRSHDVFNLRTNSNHLQASRTNDHSNDEGSEDITSFSNSDLEPRSIHTNIFEDNEQGKEKEDTNNTLATYANWTSFVLENNGSVARDHLANERTFLAWVRTALTFLLLAIGITQFSRLEYKSSSVASGESTYKLHADTISDVVRQLGRPMCVITLVLAALTIIFGVYRYFQVQMMLTRKFYPATRITVIILLILNLVMVILLLILNIKVTLK